MDEKVIRRLLHLGADVAVCPLVRLWMYDSYYMINGVATKHLWEALEHIPAERVRAKEIAGERLTADDLRTWYACNKLIDMLWVRDYPVSSICNIEDKIKELLSLGVISE